MRQILINIEPYEKRVAIIRKNELEEFYVERTGQDSLAGNIYKGRIESVTSGIGAVFVDIGTGKNGFLYIKDVEDKGPQALLNEEFVIEKRSPEEKRLSERVKKGQEVIVQVVKEPIGTKGPLLTSDISLPGKYLVLMPFDNTMGISKRIEDQGERERLKEILKRINPPEGMGCIARTESTGANPRQLRSEFRYLLNLWTRIQRRSEKQKTPSLIYEEYDLPLRIIRDYLGEDVEKIMIDSKDEYKKVYRFASSMDPRLKKKIFYYRGKTPLYERYGVEQRIEKVFHRKIFLKSGGSIIIERTESLIAIDVNTGRFTGKTSPEETAFKTNMEATEEIARQIMLRDIGGIIVIDFIDMAEKEHRHRVHQAVEEAFKRDKAKINILAVSKIGLVEMTRQRVRKNLESVSFKECPYCNGMGRVKTPTTIAIEAMRKLEKLLQEKQRRVISLTAHPDVAAHIEASFKNVLHSLESEFRKKIIVKSDSKFHVEDIYFE